MQVHTSLRCQAANPLRSDAHEVSIQGFGALDVTRKRALVALQALVLSVSHHASLRFGCCQATHEVAQKSVVMVEVSFPSPAREQCPLERGMDYSFSSIRCGSVEARHCVDMCGHRLPTLSAKTLGGSQSFRVAGTLAVPGMPSACQLGLCADRTAMFCTETG